MNNLNYVQATIEHLSLLVNSRIEFMEDYWGKQEESVEQELRNELKLFFEKELKAGSYIAWFAFDDEKFVAVGGMMLQQRPGSFRIPNGRSGYIMNMYTIPLYRKRGIAQEIINRLMNSGLELGVKIFELHSTKMGESVYVKAGFKLNEEPTFRKLVL